MRVLFFGDIVGEQTVKQLARYLPQWRQQYNIDLVIANIENSVVSHPENPWYGFGISLDTVELLSAAGVDVMTGGNHSWDAPNPELVMSHPKVLRPLNVADELPGKGLLLLERLGQPVAVVNLMAASAVGRRYTTTNPLLALESCEIPQNSLLIIDFHAESPTEKWTLARALDGRAIAVMGTHTHEPSLLLHRLPGGTFFVVDVGMNGPSGGVVGMAPDYFIQKLRDEKISHSFSLATGALQLGAVIFDVKEGTIVRLTSPDWSGMA